MRWTFQTVLAAILGACVTAVIGLGIWALAYFGDINLHLPSKLGFVSTDEYIRSNLPANYQFSVTSIRNFRGTGSSTLIVTANNTNNALFLNPHSKGYFDGIVMLLDQDSSGNFRIDYEFEPQLNVLPGYPIVNYNVSYAVAAPISVSLASVDTPVVALQWIPNLNGVPPIFGLLLFSNGASTKAVPIDTNGGPKTLPGSPAYSYARFSVRNAFGSKRQFKFAEFQRLGLVPDGDLAALYRIDKSCDACAHSYTEIDLYYDPAYGLTTWKVLRDRFRDPIPTTQFRYFNPYASTE